MSARPSPAPRKATAKSAAPIAKSVAKSVANRTLAAVPSGPASQRARAYQGFTQQILSGSIRPGQFVSQRELMTLLDMPLGAVREMIPRLEAGGLVKTVPQRGLQIAHVDLKLIRNAFQLRAMIEREAVRLFVRSVSAAELDEIEAAHKDILRRAQSAGVDAPDADLLDDAQSVDWGLHDRMVDAMGNEILSEIYRVNSLRVRLITLEQSVITPVRLIPAMEEHLRFIAALQQRDESAAIAGLEEHMDSARSRVLSTTPDMLRAGWAPPTPAAKPPNPAKPTKTTRRQT
jgi:DNA-binding GntR family transcriptional regulator